jgi:hypothetical protein
LNYTDRAVTEHFFARRLGKSTSQFDPVTEGFQGKNDRANEAADPWLLLSVIDIVVHDHFND